MNTAGPSNPRGILEGSDLTRKRLPGDSGEELRQEERRGQKNGGKGRNATKPKPQPALEPDKVRVLEKDLTANDSVLETARRDIQLCLKQRDDAVKALQKEKELNRVSSFLSSMTWGPLTRFAS